MAGFHCTVSGHKPADLVVAKKTNSFISFNVSASGALDQLAEIFKSFAKNYNQNKNSAVATVVRGIAIKPRLAYDTFGFTLDTQPQHHYSG